MTATDYIALPLERYDTLDRYRTVLALGTRWTELLGSLESGVNPVAPDLASTVCFAAIAPFADPGYSRSYLIDVVVALSQACTALQDYLIYGRTPDTFEDDFGGALSSNEVVDLLERDIAHCVWNVVTDRQMCSTCARNKSGEDWNQAVPGSPFCADCTQARADLNAAMRAR